MKFIHVSDTHIGKSNNHEKTSLIVDWILNNKDEHQSELVIISGDLVDDGEEWQFLQAREQIDRLLEDGYQVFVCPGNHDYGPTGIRESFLSQSLFSYLISGVEEYPHLEVVDGQAFILLDSMAEEIRNIELWGAQGKLGKEQLQKLDKMLDEVAENPEIENVFVVLHHHPFDFLFYHGLRDHANLKGVISQRLRQPPRVNGLIFSHKHIEHRFNDPDENKEDLFGINLIYASGSTVERNQDGKMVIPVINVMDKSIERFLI
ncbi:MAG: metallophosphoesterase [Anaerolineales bacterium]|nr:metallophosphoesterase [Anaerolineales bacterium]